MNIQVEDLEIEPDFSAHRLPLHPALDIAKDHAYVGAWIPCKVTDKKGRVRFRDLLFVIRDDGQQFLANDGFLSEKLGLRLAYRPEQIENRWGLDYVRRFLEKPVYPDPGDVLKSLVGEWATYIEFPDPRDYFYHSLWDIGTYFHPLFNGFPYLYIGGVKRSGKTKVLTLHSALAFNAIFSGNMSTASIFRLIQNSRATLLVDETEKLSDPTRELDFRGLFLFGYKKGGAVYRVEKDSSGKQVTRRFEIYGPKALANIHGLEDVLEDRCKLTFMRRSINRGIVDREVDLSNERWGELRDQLYRLYLGHWREIREKYADVSELCERNELVNFFGMGDIGPDLELISSRELELWKPIFALAMFFNEYIDLKNMPILNKFTCSLSSLNTLIWGQARDSAKEKKIEDITETAESILVRALLDLVRESDFYPVRHIVDTMARYYDEPQKWLTTRWVGSALRRLGFKEKRRIGTGYQYRLSRADVEDLALRMGLVEGSKKSSQDSGDLSESSKNRPIPEESQSEHSYSVTFLEDYPGGLVPYLKHSIPKGTAIALPAIEALELKRKFGFVELKELIRK
jgi:hypothetical protein